MRATGGLRRPAAHDGRFVTVTLLLVLALTALLGRLGQVQLVGHGDFTSVSETETRTIVVPALRGRILDRQGRPLADNRASTVVTLERRVLAERPDRAASLVRDVARVLDLPADDLLGRTWLCGEHGAPPPPACFAGSPQVAVPLAEDVDPTRALSLVEQPERFPGVAVESRPVRTYPGPLGSTAAHVLGYLGQARADEVSARDDLLPQDLVGRAGLEQQYDEALRGIPGRTVVAVDARGIVTRVVSQTDPVPGRDLVTSLDAGVQATAERALDTTMAARRKAGWPADSGAVVVLDPRTGAVAALASAPAYDPNVWTGGISATDFARLTDEEAATPLLSRAVGASFAPASTIKPASLTATVRAGNPLRGTYACPPSVRIGERVFTNYETRGHGRISLRRALEVSCDTVFYRAAHDAWRAQGGVRARPGAGEPFAEVAAGFGLGRRTGIDLPGEATGLVPDRSWKQARWDATKDVTCRRARAGYPDLADRGRAAYLQQVAREDCSDGWQFRAGDAVNLSIGQGDLSATPLQMGVMYAAIANGGTLVTPRVGSVLADPVSGGQSTVTGGPTRAAPLTGEVGTYLREALRGVVVSGSARAAFAGAPADWPVAGKTGTGEVLGKRDTSWFVSYAPAKAPEWVVSVVISQAGTGASAAAPVARAVHEALRGLP